MEVKMATVAASSRESIIPWWAVLIQGIAAIILGILLIVSPRMTTLVLVQFLGIYWLVSGIFDIVAIFVNSTLWGWKLLSGILGILAGIIIIQHPLWSAILIPTTLVIILGIQGIIIGAISLVRAFRGGGWGIGILGIVSIFFGLVLLAALLL
jgi:uncharacterized membrane protein HdeD (DUF308 family)